MRLFHDSMIVAMGLFVITLIKPYMTLCFGNIFIGLFVLILGTCKTVVFQKKS